MRIRIARTRLLAAAVIMMLVVVACTDDQLVRLSNALDDTTAALTALHTGVAAAAAANPPLMSDALIVKIGGLELKMNKALQDALNATEKVAKLSPADRTNLSNILTPVISAVNDAVKDPDIAGIKNEKTRATIQTSLVLIQTTLTTSQLMLVKK